MRGRRQVATVERVLVVVEDVLLVQFFFVDGHGTSVGGIMLTSVAGTSTASTVQSTAELRAATTAAQRHGRRFDAENARAEVDALPAGGDGGGDFGVGEAAFGADGDARWACGASRS